MVTRGDCIKMDYRCMDDCAMPDVEATGLECLALRDNYGVGKITGTGLYSGPGEAKFYGVPTERRYS